MPNFPFLDIEIKEDTEERLLEIGDKPTKNFLYAQEFNKMKTAINALRQFCILNQNSIDYLMANNTSLDLGEYDSDATFLDAFNNDWATELISPVFLKIKVGVIDYVYVFIGNPGMYGQGETELTAADVILLWQSTADNTLTQVVKNVIMKGGDFDRELVPDEMGITRYDYPDGGKAIAIVFADGTSMELNMLPDVSANIRVPSTGMGKKTLRYLEKPIKTIGTDYDIINQDKEYVLVLNNEDFVFSLHRDTFVSGDELEIINYNAVNDPTLSLADPGVVLPNQLQVWYNGDEYSMGDGIGIPLGKRALLKCIGVNKFALNIY